MTSRTHDPGRPLGSPQRARDRHAAPIAVLCAQVVLGVRIGAVAAFALLAGTSTVPTHVAVPNLVTLVLPASHAWAAAAPVVLLASLVEAALIVRLASLRGGSRRVVLLLESTVLLVSGLYVAAGFSAALVPLVCAICATAMLRLDHVRRSFTRADTERRLLGRPVRSTLYSGYAFGDPAQAASAQRIGYSVSSGAGSPGG